MYHVALTPNEYPTIALSVKSPTLLGALSDLLNALDQANESGDWIVPHVLEAAKEAIDNLENNESAKGVWSDVGSEDDAFSIDIFCEDDARYVKFDDDYLLVPHGAVGLAIGELNFQRWIYDESELPEWDNVLLPQGNAGCDNCGMFDRVEGSKFCEDCKEAIERDEETCEHTGMTRDELESLCGTPAITNPALEALRYHVTGAIERGEGVAITEQRVDAKITELIRDVKDGDCALSAIFDDGSTRKLFNFYIDELAFVDCDLLGKTQSEAIELKRARDENYLRS